MSIGRLVIRTFSWTPEINMIMIKKQKEILKRDRSKNTMYGSNSLLDNVSKQCDDKKIFKRDRRYQQ
jgi:hypothetical protein